MKRAAFSALLVPAIAHADIDAKGAHVGANTIGVESNEQGSGSVDAPFPMPALVIGAYIRKQFTPTISMQFEANVEQKRFETVQCNGPCMHVADVSVWYFAVPVLLRFDLVQGATKFHLDGGGDFVLTLGGGQTPDSTGEYERFDDLTPGNLGIVIGTGVEIPRGPGSITIDLRYKRWFAPVTDEGDAKIQMTHQIWLATGYVFP